VGRLGNVCTGCKQTSGTLRGVDWDKLRSFAGEGRFANRGSGMKAKCQLRIASW